MGIAAAGVLVAALIPGLAFAAHDASLSGSNFEIDNDANFTVEHTTPPSLDWNNVVEARRGDEPTGQTDDSYKGGVKEDTSCPDETTGSIPNNKSDLRAFGVYEEEGDPGFLHMYWTRVNDPSGTTLMDFEFNQSSTPCPQGPNVTRTANDLLIEYSIDQGGARAEITLRKWVGSSESGSWGPADTLDPTEATGTINSSEILSENTGGVADADLQPRTFGEASIDLDVIFDEESCQSFGSAMLKSRASDSFTSQLKDFISPVPITLTNCGKVIIRKVTDPAGSSASFDFTKSFSTDPSTLDTFSLSGVTTGTPPPNRKDFNNVLFGTNYTVTESSLPAGWTLQGINCAVAGHPSVGVSPSVDLASKTVTFSIDDEDDVLDCTFTNQARSTLRIDKVTVPGGDTTTDFTFNKGTSLGGGTFTLKDATTPEAFTNLVPGSYSVDEADPTPAYDLTAIGCVQTGTTTGKTATTDLTARSLSVTLGAGEDVTCTFTNTKRGSLTINKRDDADPAANLQGAVFTLYVNNAPLAGPRGAEDTITTLTCTTGANGQCSISNIPLGDYWVVETTTPAGHATAPDQAVSVTAGSSQTLNFTDPRLFKVIVLVCKEADNSLYSSNVTLPHDSALPADTKKSLAGSASPTAATLCGLGGASFGGLQKGVKQVKVDIGTNALP